MINNNVKLNKLNSLNNLPHALRYSGSQSIIIIITKEYFEVRN